MPKFNYETRQSDLNKMQAEPLDILVIGGGVTGAGIALDAQTRGLIVGLLEMRDFASGTSSRSTKLIHGGLRYLKQFAIHEVAEVGRERAIVYENAPHVTTPVWMMLPFYQGGTFGSFTTGIGLDVYDRLARVRHNERKFMLNKDDSLKREPYLKAKGLKGTGVYVEYRTDDARLVTEIVKKAHNVGALVANYVKVTNLTYDGNGQVNGVEFMDTTTGQAGRIQAKRVINAAGPWVDTIRKMDGSDVGKHLHLTKGVHLVVDHDKFPITNAIFFDTPSNDGRMMFAIPREGKTYFGTTDTTWNQDPKEPSVTKEDVTYIIDAVNGMFDIEPLTMDNIESAWAGVRPLIQEEGKSPSEISRKDEIFHSDSGLYSIAGGKLTGYRKMAEKIIDQVSKDLAKHYPNHVYVYTKTQHIPLSGGDPRGSDGFKVFFYGAEERGENHGLSKIQADKLIHRYGTNVDQVYAYLDKAPAADTKLPAVDYAQLHYGLDYEGVMHPIDYLLRRSSQMLFDFKHMLTIKDAVIDDMTKYFHWDVQTVQQMRQEVEKQIQIRQAYKTDNQPEHAVE